MPFRTKYGSHYHMTEGCHGATIPCDTNGLTPCSDCCGSGRNGGSAGSSTISVPVSTGSLGFGEADEAWVLADDVPTASPDASDGAIDASDEADRAGTISDIGVEGATNGQPLPDEEVSFEELFKAAFGMTDETQDNSVTKTPEDRIRGLFDVIDDPQYDDSILILADIAANRKFPKGRETEHAIMDGAKLTHTLVDMAREESDPEKREELLQAAASLANDGVLKGTLKSLEDFPAKWHNARSLSVACNQHDMFYVTKALADKSERRKMTLDDFEDGVLPLMDTLEEFAASGFRQFPRTIKTTKRFPDGPDGDKAWGTQESILVTADDVDDPKVLAIMDRGDTRGKSGMDVYYRGVPGYWLVGMDPKEERREHIETTKWMVRHSSIWNKRRGIQAVRDFDKNMMPVLSWLARRGVTDKLRKSGNVEAFELL